MPGAPQWDLAIGVSVPVGVGGRLRASAAGSIRAGAVRASNHRRPSLASREYSTTWTRPVSIVVLERQGNRYVSAARAENEGPCLDEDGDAIRGGAKVTSTTPDGKSTIESGDRWVATAIKEGQQWKISNLVQVI